MPLLTDNVCDRSKPRPVGTLAATNQSNGWSTLFSTFCKTKRAVGGSWNPWNDVGRFSVPRTITQMTLLSPEPAGKLPVTRIDFWNGIRLKLYGTTL